MRGLVDDTVARCGSLDVLVNNAGLYATLAMRPFTEIPLDEWRRVMDVNVASMFLTCRAAVPVMRAQGGGTIVNISSGTPFRGVPFLLALRHEQRRDRRLHARVGEGAREGRHPGELRRSGLHDVAGRPRESRGRREAPGGLGLGAHDPARPGAGRRRRRGRVSRRRGVVIRDRADDRHRRRPVRSTSPWKPRWNEAYWLLSMGLRETSILWSASHRIGTKDGRARVATSIETVGWRSVALELCPLWTGCARRSTASVRLSG